MGMGGSAIRAGRAFVELFADDKKLVRGLRQAERRLKKFGNSVTSAGKKIFQASTIALIPFVLSAGIFANYSDQMLKVKAVTSGTISEYEKLNQKAKELGRTTSYSSAQVASGMVELGRAGFSRGEIDQSISGVLNLARATDTELPEAAAIAGASLRQFGMEANQMHRVVDVLTATANGSAQNLTDLGEALKPVAPIASEAGESIEQVSAAIAVLANNGIKGSLAGTALARAYKNLSSDKVASTLKKLGVNAVDASGNLRPMADILNDVGKATKDMGTAGKLNIFETLFGRGQAAALKLAGNGAIFDDLKNAIESSGGIAAKTAKEMDSGLGGVLRRLWSAIEGVAIAIGESITPALSKWGDKLSYVAGVITKFINQNQKSIGALFSWLVLIAGVGAGLVGFGMTIQVVAFSLGGLAMLVPAIVAGFGILTTVLGAILSPLGIIIIGFGSLAVSIEKTTGIGRAGVSSLLGLIRSLGTIVANTFSSIYEYFRQTSQVFATVTDMMIGAVSRIMRSFNEMGETASLVFTGIRDAMASGDFALAAEVLWTGLKLAFLQGTAPLTELWNNVLYGLVDTWIVVWAEIKSVMIEASGFLQSAWQTTVSALARQIVWLMSKVDKTIDVDDAYNTLNQQLNSKLKAIDSAREKAQTANAADRDAMLGGSRNVYEKKKSDAEKALANAQKKLSESLSKAAGEAKQAQEERKEEKKLPGNKPKDLGFGSFSPASDKLGGTFSALSSLMFGGSVSSTVTEGEKQIVSKLDDVVTAIDEGALA